MFGFKLHRSKPRPISAFEYFGNEGKRMTPFRLTPDDIAIARLLEHRKYLREEKIPALERLFDILKEKLGASGGNAGSWHLSEYNEVHRQN
jgi:hypothetical protein